MNRIVVGVDGSSEAETALRWAIAEADRHDATVVALMAWAYLDQHHGDKSDAFDPTYGEEEALEALRASVARAETLRPVELRVVCDLPARAARSRS